MFFAQYGYADIEKGRKPRPELPLSFLYSSNARADTRDAGGDNLLFM
jgi:hypothetical protein